MAGVLGALVEAEYADGSSCVQRYGSAANSAYGQSLPPLRFGSPSTNPLARVRVRWPARRDGTAGETGLSRESKENP